MQEGVRFSITLRGELGSWHRVLAPGEIAGRVIHPPGRSPFSTTWYDADPRTAEEARRLGSATFSVPEGRGTCEILLPMPER